ISGAIEATPILRVRAHSARGQEAAERHAGSALVWPLHTRPFVPRDTTDLLRFVQGCTFDDFLLTPQLGIVPSRDPAVIDLTSQFTSQIALTPARSRALPPSGSWRNDELGKCGS